MVETQNQLRQITIFDRQGKVVKTVGQPDFYFDPSISPEGSRLVMRKRDPVTGNIDIWTLDLATGKTYSVTNDSWGKFDQHWSPDGTKVAYEKTIDEYTGTYRKAWDGTGEEELLFRDTPGAGMGFSDWSPDGKFLTGSNGAMLMIPLRANEKALDRKALDWMREEYDVQLGRFSPDMRSVAYMANQADVNVEEVYVRAFDANKPEVPGTGAPVHVPGSGARALLSWRRDGRELYYVTRAWEVAAVDVSTTPELKTGVPKILFKLPGPLPGDTDSWKNVNANGDRFVFAIPVK